MLTHAQAIHPGNTCLKVCHFGGNGGGLKLAVSWAFYNFCRLELVSGEMTRQRRTAMLLFTCVFVYLVATGRWSSFDLLSLFGFAWQKWQTLLCKYFYELITGSTEAQLIPHGVHRIFYTFAHSVQFKYLTGILLKLTSVSSVHYTLWIYIHDHNQEMIFPILFNHTHSQLFD